MDNIQINGVAVTDANFNDTTPAASAGRELLLWQRSGTGPDSVSVQTTVNIPIVINRAMSDLTIVNTGVETTFYSFSVPANTMSTNRILRLFVVADYKAETTGSTATIRMKFGGTTIFSDITASIGMDADRRALFFEFLLGNQGATNDQTGGGIWLPQIYAATTAPTTGIAGDMADTATDGTSFITADSAIDTTAAQTIDCTWQWTTSGAANEFRRRMAVLQIV